MPLSDALIRSFFGSDDVPRVLLVGLAASGKELADPGYERQRVLRGEWRIRGATAAADVTLGPFRGAVTFDEAVLYDPEGVELDRSSIGAWTVPANQNFFYSAEFEVRTVPEVVT